MVLSFSSKGLICLSNYLNIDQTCTCGNIINQLMWKGKKKNDPGVGGGGYFSEKIYIKNENIWEKIELDSLKGNLLPRKFNKKCICICLYPYSKGQKGIGSRYAALFTLYFSGMYVLYENLLH